MKRVWVRDVPGNARVEDVIEITRIRRGSKNVKVPMREFERLMREAGYTEERS